MIATIGVDDDGQAYNINADTVAGAIAEALGAEKLVYLTDVAGRLRATGPTSRQPDLAHRRRRARARSIADGKVAGGHDPQGRVVRRTPCATACGRAHILDGRIPHALLLEFFTRRGHRNDGAAMTHDARFDELRRSTPSTCMQTYGRLPVAFVRGEGTKLWDSEGKRVPRLPRRARGHVARPRPPGGRRRDRRPGAHAAARVEPVLQRRRSRRSRRTPRRACSAAAGRCSSPTPAPRPTSARSSSPAATARRNGGPERFHVVVSVRLVPRPHARHARRHRPAAEAGDVPAAARGLPPGRVRRPRRARRRRSTTAVARGAARAGAGRGRRATRRRPSYLAGRAPRCATSARRC